MIKIITILHVLGASVWVGGHLILLLRFLPQALREKNPGIILAFEKKYEPIGVPALLLQVITGIILGYHYQISLFSFKNQFDITFNLKLILLLMTILFGVHARFFLIPKLNEKNLNSLAYHILAVTLLSIGFVYLGISFRTGY
ncbi:MAG: hypothetical protein HGGPFJEG_01935 [Ignavibacteria bacterium]|nr:hypothetical protein [Ignavibacteria bacterium]